MLKLNKSVLKFRLYLWFIVIVLVLFLGSFLATHTLVTSLSIFVIVLGAVLVDRIFTRKNQHIDLLENMEAVNKAINHSTTVEDLLFNVLSVVQDILKTDRAWLLYPCDPDAASWQVPMEVTKPEYPGAMALKESIA